jgi:hypothetical protein
VNREEFESSVLDLWVTTRIPLSRAHLQYHTGLSRQRLNRWLDELIADGVLEYEVDDNGDMLWIIPGAERSTTGPRTFAELGRGGAPGNNARARAGATNQAGVMRDKNRRRNSALEDADDALASVSRAALTLAGKGGVQAKKGDGEKEKSLAVSAGLSLLGPIGWLYAGSLREAALGTVAAVLLWKILPGILLGPLLYLGLPISALAGLVYAWQYNRRGERTTLFLGGKKGDKDKDD